MENIKKELLWRLYTVFGAVLVVGLFIFLRAVHIQVNEGAMWLAKADSLHVRYKKVDAERGNILSADGSLLATSISLFDIRMDCTAAGITDEEFELHVDSLGFYLATYINNALTPPAWSEYLRLGRAQKNRYLLIKKGVTYPERQYIQTLPLFRLGRNRGGLIVEAHSKREHPFKMLAHRTIGYTRDNAQSVGLESYFDKHLAGTNGQQLMQRISGDVWIPVNDITEVAPQNGRDVLTTIDVNLQDITENALEKMVRARDADHGCAIVMDVKTGAIKAIANIGRTEAKDESSGVSKLWETYNFAVGERTPPGSTFKLASMLLLLEDGYIKLTDTIDINLGRMKYGEDEMVDAEAHGLRKTTIQHAFEISSNVGISQLANQFYNQTDAGRKRYIKQLKALNLGERTGVDLDGEPNPDIREVGKGLWSGNSIPWMSIGYENELTPLQILTLYNAVANKGRMMKPYLVEEIQDYGESYLKFVPKTIKSSIASSTTIDKLKQLLVGVVERGTARNISGGNVRIAGKTGTAILNFNSNSRAAKKYQASFCGFFPAENPQYSCIVVMNNPRNGQYGALAAAPVVKEIAEKSVAARLEAQVALNFGVKPNFKTPTLPNNNAGYKEDVKRILSYMNISLFDKTGKNEFSTTSVKNDSLSLYFRPLPAGLVPNVTGMGLRDALYLLENKGIRVRFSGIGKVKSQSVMPGTRAAGQTCVLNLD
jgi:cell division protein FtsI (penicillin-binding protein 3)